MRASLVIAAMSAALGVVAAGAGSPAVPDLTGDAQGIRLTRAVDAAYRKIPGFESRGVFRITDGRRLPTTQRVALVAGLVVAEDLLISSADGRVSETLTTAQGEFERNPGERCWTRRDLPDDNALGGPVFSGPGDHVERPRATKRGIVVNSQSSDGHSTETLIDRKTHRMIRARAVLENVVLDVRFRILSVRPRIQPPANVC